MSNLDRSIERARVGCDLGYCLHEDAARPASAGCRSQWPRLRARISDGPARSGRWERRPANSAMAVTPWAPASLAATATASTVASRCRTPRAARYSGTSRRKSYRLRSRSSAGGSGSPRPAPPKTGSSRPPSAARARGPRARAYTCFGVPCTAQPPSSRA